MRTCMSYLADAELENLTAGSSIGAKAGKVLYCLCFLLREGGTAASHQGRDKPGTRSANPITACGLGWMTITSPSSWLWGIN